MIYHKHLTKVGQIPYAAYAAWYLNDTCIFHEDKDVQTVLYKYKVLYKELLSFLSICEWFIENKLSIHFRDHEAKTFFFSQKPTKTKHIICDYYLKQRYNALL